MTKEELRKQKIELDSTIKRAKVLKAIRDGFGLSKYIAEHIDISYHIVIYQMKLLRQSGSISRVRKGLTFHAEFICDKENIIEEFGEAPIEVDKSSGHPENKVLARMMGYTDIPTGAGRKIDIEELKEKHPDTPWNPSNKPSRNYHVSGSTLGNAI